MTKRSRTITFLVLILAVFRIFFGNGEICRAQTIDAKKAAKIKAGILYHLVNLVAWPDNRFDSDQSAIEICFIGKDQGGLVNSFESQSRSFIAQGRKLHVKRLHEIELVDNSLSQATRNELKRCHIVYVTSSEENQLKEIVAPLKNIHVLTVGETESFLSSGGMVAFLIDKNRVRIRVNLDMVKLEELSIGAQFLQHATIIKSKKETSLLTGENGRP